MKRNPINIMNDRILKATQLIETAMRVAIHIKRAKKFNKIDLRHYKSDPDKKDRIRKIVALNHLITFHLSINMITIASHPIRKHNFQPGGISTKQPINQ